jgi:hypothetical protein
VHFVEHFDFTRLIRRHEYEKTIRSIKFLAIAAHEMRSLPRGDVFLYKLGGLETLIFVIETKAGGNEEE